MSRGLRGLQIAAYLLYVAGLSASMFYLLSIMGGEGGVVAWIATGVTAGCAVMMSVYGLSLHLGRAKERALLFFSLFCLFTAMRLQFLQGGPAGLLYPLLEERAVLLIRSLSTSGAGLFHFYFVLEMFGRGKERGLRWVFTLWIAAAALVNNLFSLVGTTPGNIIGLVTGLSMLGCSIAVILRSGKLDRNIHRMYLIASIIDLFSFTLASLRVPNLAILWSFVYIIANTLLLADRYTAAMTAVETANETLEETVAERTAELREANAQVTASEQSLKELVGNISHDLKTPLTVVGLQLEQLASPTRPVSDAERQRMAAVAYNKTLDLQRLTRNLFELVRMEEGHARYSLVWVGLGGLMDEVSRRYDAYCESEGVLLAVRFTGQGQVRIDPEKIWSVFDNIINNALRYTPKGGSITVTAERAGQDTVEITVRDTGCGIGAAHLPHIFERYYMADESRGGGGDSGLGLYIVKSIVEGMGGTVWAQSAPGEGMAVTFTLPAE